MRQPESAPVVSPLRCCRSVLERLATAGALCRMLLVCFRSLSTSPCLKLSCKLVAESAFIPGSFQGGHENVAIILPSKWACCWYLCTCSSDSLLYHRDASSHHCFFLQQPASRVNKWKQRYFMPVFIRLETKDFVTSSSQSLTFLGNYFLDCGETWSQHITLVKGVLLNSWLVTDQGRMQCSHWWGSSPLPPKVWAICHCLVVWHIPGTVLLCNSWNHTTYIVLHHHFKFECPSSKILRTAPITDYSMKYSGTL